MYLLWGDTQSRPPSDLQAPSRPPEVLPPAHANDKGGTSRTSCVSSPSACHLSLVITDSDPHSGLCQVTCGYLSHCGTVWVTTPQMISCHSEQYP